MSAVTFSFRGDREIAKLIDSLSGQALQNRTRRATRAGAAVMRKDLRRRAAGGQYPKTFRKIATRSSTRTGIRTQVGPTSPLHIIFEGGAGSHRVAPRKKLVLSNREANFFSRGPVRHPGMKARPLTTPAFEATKDAAGVAAMNTLLEGLR